MNYRKNTRHRGRAGVRRRGEASPFAILPLALLLTTACAKATASEPGPGFKAEDDRVHLSQAVRPVRFQTEPAKVGAAIAPPLIAGRVATVESLTMRSFAPLSGRLLELRVRTGDRVAKGDKLVRVQTSELAAIHHDVSAAGLTVKTKQALLERLEQLRELRSASETEVLLAKSELAEAKLRGAASSQVLRSLAVLPADATSYWLVAPRAGTVVSLSAVAGAEVGPGSGEPIAVISDLDEVLVVASVPAGEATGLVSGTAARVVLPGGGQSFVGTLEAVSEVVDPDTQTVSARLRVANQQRVLRPNGYVDVSFQSTNAAEVLTVPTDAVVSDGSASVVFVETKPLELQRRPVRLGRQGRERTEIVSGLKPGEQVVTTGALLLLNALDSKG